MIPRPRRRALFELAHLARGIATLPLAMASLPRLPRGSGRPVLVVPGFMTSDRATVALRRWLRLLGYCAYGWGLGTNRGQVPKLVPRVVARVAELADLHGERVALVGWSVGGVIAREAARQSPDRVARVVTLGTPVVGGPKYTLAASYYEKKGFDLDALERRAAEQNAATIPVPITAVFSKIDSIVAWQACLDPNPDNRVEHIELGVGHVELGFSYEAFRVLARSLAAPQADPR